MRASMGAGFLCCITLFRNSNEKLADKVYKKSLTFGKSAPPARPYIGKKTDRRT